MATSQSTIDFLLDQLGSLPGVRAKKMFGEYAIYFEDKVVGLVCDDRLFVKITPQGAAFVAEHYEEGLPYPGAKPAILVGAEDIDDPERLSELIRVTAAALPAPKPKAMPKRGASTRTQAKSVARRSVKSEPAAVPRKATAPGRVRRKES